jgi:hypothetical protein
MDVLKSNTYSGLEAKIKFNNWKKIWATEQKSLKGTVKLNLLI